VSGPVVTALGNASTAGYTIVGNWITGTFDIPYTGDVIKLLTGAPTSIFTARHFPGRVPRSGARHR